MREEKVVRALTRTMSVNLFGLIDFVNYLLIWGTTQIGNIWPNHQARMGYMNFIILQNFMASVIFFESDG